MGSSLWASFTTPASIFRWERANMPGNKKNSKKCTEFGFSTSAYKFKKQAVEGLILYKLKPRTAKKDLEL